MTFHTFYRISIEVTACSVTTSVLLPYNSIEDVSYRSTEKGKVSDQEPFIERDDFEKMQAVIRRAVRSVS